MRHRRIDLVIDVGANVGQYARTLRTQGYRQRIVSFEPLPQAFAKLSRAAARDIAWTCYPFALGPTLARGDLNVSQNRVSSSLLPMLERHVEAAPNSRYLTEVEVEIRPLDSFMHELDIGSHRTHLKLDVQGYEMGVLQGARSSLEHVQLLELELSLVPLYEGQPLFRDVLTRLEQLGFELVSLAPGFADPRTGHLLQFDAIFDRTFER
jgi:FkbM family methyltransferase